VIGRRVDRETVDAPWVSQTAGRVLAAMEERRSTTHIRTTDIPAEHSDALVDKVLHTRSVLLALAPPDHGIEEPEGLRRVDGSSVYTVAGADLYTSTRILDLNGASSLPPDVTTARPSTRRRWIWPCSRWQ
jgi:hypothetical protein